MVFNCLPALHKKVEPFIQSNQFTSVSVNSGDDKESLSESLLVKHLGIYRVQLTWFNVPVYFLVQENIHKGIQESDACIDCNPKLITLTNTDSNSKHEPRALPQAVGSCVRFRVRVRVRVRVRNRAAV